MEVRHLFLPLAQPLPTPPPVLLWGSSRLCKRTRMPPLHSEHSLASSFLCIRLHAPLVRRPSELTGYHERVGCPDIDRFLGTRMMEPSQTSMFKFFCIDLSPSESGFPRTDLDAKFNELNDCRDKLTAYFDEVDKSNINKLNETATAAQAALFANDCTSLKKQVEANEAKIISYQSQLMTLGAPPSATDIQDVFAIAAGIPPAGPDVTSSTDPNTSNEADYWTSITVEVSSSYSAEQSSSSSNYFSVGGGASWGLWSVGGGASHSDYTADAASQMANSDIKASFDCMRVDISRSWLRGELFYDDDLRVAAGN